MKVLIADVDLFRVVGGGQTFYRNIILRNPQIDFYYLRRSEPADVVRPANAHALDFVEHYKAYYQHDFQDVFPPRWVRAAFDKASNIALSVLGHSFDVVDLPDYEQFGIFMAPALAHHRVGCGRVALSMHGRISTTISMNWLSEGSVDLSLNELEEMQYAAVDTRYFISPMYRDEWQALCQLDSYCIDPMWFFPLPEARPYGDSPGQPSLNFIGRTEKRKGPHLFLQLAWWLPKDCYSAANIIGPDNIDQTGTGSSVYLRAIAEARGVNCRIHRCMTPAELAALYATKAVAVLPSQYDTLNLTALEALFAGCPTVVGDGAGACRYLTERFPGVPFLTFPVADWYSCVPAVEELLRNYRRHRDRLHDALERADFRPRGPGLDHVYTTTPAPNPAVRVQLEAWYDQLLQAQPPPATGRPYLRLVA